MGEERFSENEDFRIFLQSQDKNEIDQKVKALNNQVEQQVDCTTCGACCSGLMINVTEAESVAVSKHLSISPSAFKEQYIEESLGGQLIINTIPCHFLKEKKCTIYKERFAECRDFPHLHKANFNGRLFGTLMHYSICPIIFNVVELLKIETGFLINRT